MFPEHMRDGSAVEEIFFEHSVSSILVYSLEQ